MKPLCEHTEIGRLTIHTSTSQTQSTSYDVKKNLCTEDIHRRRQSHRKQEFNFPLPSKTKLYTLAHFVGAEILHVVSVE